MKARIHAEYTRLDSTLKRGSIKLTCPEGKRYFSHNGHNCAVALKLSSPNNTPRHHGYPENTANCKKISLRDFSLGTRTKIIHHLLQVSLRH